jgi:4a-hydroxytetrahydrobiopterin dehydratase
MKLLSADEIEKKLVVLVGWSCSDKSIQKEFELDNFSDAVTFIVEIGFEAERLDHHPDLLLHSWNKVKVTLSTHSEGGVTDNDINLAYKINSIRK